MNYNKYTRVTAATFSILIGMGGIFNHGLFEVLQGNNSTNSFFIEAIGKANRYWIHGTEGAFTIIPNFLITGILVISVGLAIIVWSVKFIHKEHGSSVLLSLFFLLTIFGGGIGHIILFLPTWAYSTRINRSLQWYKKILTGQMRKVLSGLWIYCLATTSVLWILVMELGIWGRFPGQSDPDIILNLVFVFLFSSVILANCAFICGFAKDIEERESEK